MAFEKPTVALTRSSIENRSLALALADYGIETLEVPMIEIVVSDENASALERVIAHLDSYQWLVFTSANGVRSFDAIYSAAAPVSIDNRMRVAVVGPATRAALGESAIGRQLIGIVDTGGEERLLMPPIASAANLVEEFPIAVTAATRQRVLVVLGQLADKTVAEGLASKGYEVHRVDAYQNVPVQQAADSALANAVAFFSPSAVDRFCELYGAGLPAVCIGHRTAQQATDRGFKVVAVAEPHTETGVVHQLVTFFS